MIPLGYDAFVATHPGEFENSYPAATFDDMATLDRINRWVNHGIVWSSTYQGERWAIWPQTGPCHDYAVTKRHELIKAGCPGGALALLDCLARGEGHMPLLVKTSGGVIVLDSLDDVIYPLDETGYEIVAMQSFTNPSEWNAP